MIYKLINKLNYKVKTVFRQFFFYFRFFKNKERNYWKVKNFDTYEKYISFQKEKTLDKDRRSKWLNEEWDTKVNFFNEIFKNIFKEINFNQDGKCLCIGARTGQEVYALQNLGFSAIGIDIVECKPLVEIGDMHNLKYSDNSFVIDLFVVRLEPFRRKIILFLSIFFKYSSRKAELVTNTLSELLRKFFSIFL